MTQEELDRINAIVQDNVEPSIAADIAQNNINWPLQTDSDYQWYIENHRPDIESVDFNFIVKPSRSSWRNSMSEFPTTVDAEIIWESIGPRGEDDAIFQVNVDWPSGSTDAPSNRTYVMPYSEIEAWSQDPSGTYFNTQIRGKFTSKS